MGVVASRHPIRSALWLVLSLAATAVCYLGLHADFAAAAQAVVYVGAIVVLIVFAIMLLKLKGDAWDGRAAPETVVACAIGAGLFLSVFPAWRALAAEPKVADRFGSAGHLGELLLGKWLLPFELVSLLLLAAMVAAISLGRKEKGS